MAVHKSHGKPRPEVPRADELPTGVAAPPADAGGPIARAAGGKVATSEAARELGRRGGKAKAEKMSREGQIRRRLRLHGLVPHVEADSFVRPLLEENERWLQAVMEGMARDVGGGHLSAGVCAILTYAAQDRVMSSFYFELASSKNFAWTITKDKDGKAASLDPRTELAAKARELGISSRGHLQSAHELAAKEAQSRKAAPKAATNALAERVEKLIALEQQNAQRWKQLDAQQVVTVEDDAQPATDTRVSVAPSASPEPLRSGPVRTHAPVAPSASPTPPRTSPAPSMPAVAPSAPRGGQAPSSMLRALTPEERDEDELRACASTFLANEKRRTIDQARAAADAQSRALAILETRYIRAQDIERRWRASGARGRMPVPSIVVPFPTSKWWRDRNNGAEAAYSQRVFGWVLQPEEKKTS